MRLALLVGLVFLSGCTITWGNGHPAEITIIGVHSGVLHPNEYRHPHPMIYPDSVFCDNHPDECIGDNDV